MNTVSKEDRVAVRVKPVRCPEGIEQACTFAYQICFETVMSCINGMARGEWPSFQQRIVQELRQRALELATKKLLNIRWESRPDDPK